jgi:hypothetical protein
MPSRDSPYQPTLTGKNILCVLWIPGSDTLVGICHCGARFNAADPIEVWEWLLGHPVGHGGPSSAPIGGHPIRELIGA